jgi:hypothetical protein
MVIMVEEENEYVTGTDTVMAKLLVEPKKNSIVSTINQVVPQARFTGTGKTKYRYIIYRVK